MSERRFADFFGLLAYLTVMYGRLPDRQMLSAAYDTAGALTITRSPPHLTVVPPSGELPAAPGENGESIDVAA